MITFTPSLKYIHYGSTLTVSQKGLQIDNRAAVGHLTRNIKIQSGNDLIWGFRILTYGYSECNNAKFGVLRLSGV